MQTEIHSASSAELWEQLSPLLDEALATLAEKDRQAVLLRFFENKSLAEVGQSLGTGEDTARKRVARALEKLHRYFGKRGVSSTTAIIAGTLTANSVQAAPVMLTKSVTVVALAKGSAVSGSTLTLIKGALKIMAWTKAKTAIVIGAAAIITVGTTVVVDYRMTAEPSYGGKTVTEWLDTLVVYKEQWATAESYRVVYPTPEEMTNNPAFHALMKIGSKAVPILIKRIEDRGDWPRKTRRLERAKLWLDWNWSRLQNSHPSHPPALENFSKWQQARKNAAGFALLALGTNANGGFIRYAEAYADAPKHQSIYGTEMAGSPIGVTSGFIIGSAKSSLPNRQDEIIGGILQGLQHTNAWCRVVSLECIIQFPEDLAMWKDRLAELAQDDDEVVQEAAFGDMIWIAQSEPELKIMPAVEIRTAAEAVLANPKTSKRVRDIAETVRSLSERP